MMSSRKQRRTDGCEFSGVMEGDQGDLTRGNMWIGVDQLRKQVVGTSIYLWNY